MFNGDETGIMIERLIIKADKLDAVRFAVNTAERALSLIDDESPSKKNAAAAHAAAKAYIAGSITVKEARKAAFAAHAAARIAVKGSAACFACRAAGHAAATAHCKEHASACAAYAAKAFSAAIGESGFLKEREIQLKELKSILSSSRKFDGEESD